MAKRFKLGREQWFDMLEKERGVSPQEYARDIVWPTLALRKLAADSIEVSREEIDKAFEQSYGEMISARLIAVNNAELARQLHAKLTANPESFARTAIEHSIDVNSASVGGLIQPIRRHVGDPAIEREAFAMQQGQISSIISVARQFVILKCERRIPVRPVNQVEIEQQIVEKSKMKSFARLPINCSSNCKNLPRRSTSSTTPSSAKPCRASVATVNGDRITLKQLGQECLLRHGEEVLDMEISQLLLEQALKRANVKVTEADLQAEVRHARCFSRRH